MYMYEGPLENIEHLYFYDIVTRLMGEVSRESITWALSLMH